MEAPAPRLSTARYNTAYNYAAVAYVASVLTLDLMATYGYVPALRWTHRSGFDLFKFVFWLVIPLAAAAPFLEWQFFTFRRWKRGDWVILAALTAAGLAALVVVPHIPQLRAMYPDQSHYPAEVKQAQILRLLIWDLSWLPGWEFLHRYTLLRAATARWPRYGWLLVPLCEGLYHLPKDWLEALGMTAFSLVATFWAWRRRNLLLPLVAHAAIEVALLWVLFA